MRAMNLGDSGLRLPSFCEHRIYVAQNIWKAFWPRYSLHVQKSVVNDVPKAWITLNGYLTRSTIWRKRIELGEQMDCVALGTLEVKTKRLRSNLSIPLGLHCSTNQVQCTSRNQKLIRLTRKRATLEHSRHSNIPVALKSRKGNTTIYLLDTLCLYVMYIATPSNSYRSCEVGKWDSVRGRIRESARPHPSKHIAKEESTICARGL